ncbi:hypothetical protein D3C86_2198360 [compost metagenome]
MEKTDSFLSLFYRLHFQLNVLTNALPRTHNRQTQEMTDCGGRIWRIASTTLEPFCSLLIP